MRDPEDPALKLHIEPDRPIEVDHLTAALGSLSRQYQKFVVSEGYVSRTADARLLVASVSHGSVDISFIPDWASAAGLFLGSASAAVDRAVAIERFAGYIAKIIGFFRRKSITTPEAEREGITAKDCEDVVNILRPVAESGGSKTFITNNIHSEHTVVIQTTAAEARSMLEEAVQTRALLRASFPERRQQVPMVWQQLGRDAAKTTGSRSTDKGLIEEIDERARPVLFADEISYIKREMIDDEANPYQKVYFVDVDVLRVGDNITAYRIVGYHGKDDFNLPQRTTPEISSRVGSDEPSA